MLFGILFLFVLRVIAQLLVASGLPSFLPPMEEWQSGALTAADDWAVGRRPVQLVSARQTVWHTQDAPSRLILPIIPRAR